MVKFILNSNKEHLDINLIGDLDIDSTEVIEEELIPATGSYKTINLIFTEVPFVDSSGMGLLINLVKLLNEKEQELTISNVREEVMEVFELLQLPEILGEKVFV
ncbi:STAS domain-containing protein [Bacillus benzoevorans]|uniref:Anti-sigma B factor antagonist/stage II sporulation protein AA (Anti-sigma F factor antagonist) n=1 Tax=Bacillus benzoevorans TaxID=1456 RepID=A0A7X0LW23_9BACI|nr:STAS domain-containing protein [Bacillus benzoevorans]MBB6446140.1 anti-sigma B factor antagonist/stage II sporulation protein AA (anti-sigma F factor antagonist) [Bacillus benzoevorans]